MQQQDQALLNVPDISVAKFLTLLLKICQELAWEKMLLEMLQ